VAFVYYHNTFPVGMPLALLLSFYFCLFTFIFLLLSFYFYLFTFVFLLEIYHAWVAEPEMLADSNNE